MPDLVLHIYNVQISFFVIILLVQSWCWRCRLVWWLGIVHVTWMTSTAHHRDTNVQTDKQGMSMIKSGLVTHLTLTPRCRLSCVPQTHVLFVIYIMLRIYTHVWHTPRSKTGYGNTACLYSGHSLRQPPSYYNQLFFLSDKTQDSAYLAL